jgi:hypothetical protein
MPPEESAPLFVLMRALVLAQRSKASEIGIDHILGVLDDVTSMVEPTIRPEPPLSPVPKQDLSLSAGVKAAIEPLGDISGVSLGALRSVLLDAKRRGAS